MTATDSKGTTRGNTSQQWSLFMPEDNFDYQPEECDDGSPLADAEIEMMQLLYREQCDAISRWMKLYGLAFAAASPTCGHAIKTNFSYAASRLEVLGKSKGLVDINDTSGNMAMNTNNELSTKQQATTALGEEINEFYNTGFPENSYTEEMPEWMEEFFDKNDHCKQNMIDTVRIAQDEYRRLCGLIGMSPLGDCQTVALMINRLLPNARIIHGWVWCELSNKPGEHWWIEQDGETIDPLCADWQRPIVKRQRENIACPLLLGLEYSLFRQAFPAERPGTLCPLRYQVPELTVLEPSRPLLPEWKEYWGLA